ncbi:MAG: phospholipid-binding lipoprotein MlaA [Gammaproteobacteria bacterium]|jgi:phospholipid-binding lipoprotein MlaA
MNKYKLKDIAKIISLVFVIALATGCASNQEKSAATPDPLEPMNRAFYSFNEGLDQHLIKPIAEAYVNITPEPIRVGVTNFYANLAYLNVILNSFLQGKFEQGFSDAGRFLINSTLGIGGIFDVATPAGLPRHNEDLGQTLATWGVERGTYLYLPIQGPDTARNLPNIATRLLLNPITYLSGAILFPITALNVINIRANLLDATNIRDEAAVDPYSFTREAYLQQREYLIHDGNPPTEGYDDIFDEEGGFGDDEDSVLIIE